MYIQLFGTLGKTPTKLLSESGFAVSSVKNYNVMANDIGLVEKIKVSMKEEDSWRPLKIFVKRAGLEETSYETKGEQIDCPAKCSITIANVEKPI